MWASQARLDGESRRRVSSSESVLASHTASQYGGVGTIVTLVEIGRSERSSK